MTYFYDFRKISRTKLFERIPPADIPNAIKCLGGFQKCFANEEAVYGGNSENFLPGLVLDGCVHINQIFQDGSTVLVRTANSGDLFGVSLAFEKDENIFVTSSGNTTVLFLHLPSKDSVNSCNCKYKMIILENLIYILSRNNKFLNEKIQILSRPSLREKLILFLSNQQNIQNSNTIQLNMTREKIAQYINADRSAVSRELGKMQQDGLIEIKNKYIRIKSFKSFI